MNKVIFVGVHNKPGLTPLDSKSKSGKIIDQVIDRVTNAIPVECSKANIYPVDYMPLLDERERLVDSFQVDDTALYIGLGRVSCGELIRLKVNLIQVYHPGSLRWSGGTVEDYVSGTASLIRERIYSLTESL